ncbi:MAG: hypothetical protein K6T55_09935 [Syntrophobacterales bacterium]|nr:hypothetical protein [Syntrophobacterales bacterium]
MKKHAFFAVVLVALLALPAMGLAQTEFSLGGYLKLESFWDSKAIPKNINLPPAVLGDRNATHGRFNMTAQSSRFNFTIKGPKLWGATITGFLEVDFDVQGDDRQSASHAYQPRLRHAFFRMNWPGTELLFGQYWSFFSEFYPELVQDGPFQGHGCATHRLPQIRVTQEFGMGPGKLTLSGLIGKPTDTNDSGNLNYPISNSPLEGQTSETPQLQAKIQYEADLWGKAGFYGRPRGFVAQVAGGWQRSRYRTDDRIGPLTDQQEYLNNWVIQGTLFIPVIPTTTANLAGTSALTVQAYVGQGLDFIGNGTGMNHILHFHPNRVDRHLVKTWGGYVQANYYFSNQWFLNVAAGLGSNYDVDTYTDVAASTRPVHHWWEVSPALYYRPISAVKFGLQYTYTRANYYRMSTYNPATGAISEFNPPTNWGDAHSVRFGAWFFF